MLPRVKHRIAISLVALIMTGCRDLQALRALQQGLATEFNAPELRVNIYNGTTLTVVLQRANVPASDTSNGLEQQATCRRVAEFVRDHYAGYGRLNQVNVTYDVRTLYGPVHMTRSQTPCTFRTAELGSPSGSAAAGRIQ